MSVNISSNFTQRHYRWAAWKAVYDKKHFLYQYDDDGSVYTIWGYDVQDAHITYIWKGEVPYTVVDDGYSQAQNDADRADFEANYKPDGNKKLDVPDTQGPFAAKVLPNGKKLYLRKHGIQATVAGAPDNIDFVIPYDNCKLTAMEVIGGQLGDTVNFKVLDTPTGTISGVPNYVLNQFGFGVNIAPDYYESACAYDADLIKDMKIRIEYDSINSDLLPKTAYINITLHEVKP